MTLELLLCKTSWTLLFPSKAKQDSKPTLRKEKMALLLETAWGDLVVELDVEGSPHLCKNVLQLAKARQYTQSLVHRISSNTAPPFASSSPSSSASSTAASTITLCCMGCPRGTGLGGASIHAYLEAAEQLSLKKKDEDEKGNGVERTAHSAQALESLVETSRKRFLAPSRGQTRFLRHPQRGDVVALELPDLPDTVGSQFGIVLQSTSSLPPPSSSETVHDENDHNVMKGWPSLGKVVEDSGNVLDKLMAALCDPDGRPWADIRIFRALVVYDPYENENNHNDPPGWEQLLRLRGIVVESRSRERDRDVDVSQDESESDTFEDLIAESPDPPRPPAETAEVRVPVQELDLDDDDDDPEGSGKDPAALRQRAEEAARREDHGRAVVLELLGDLPDADLKAPEHVLFVCKLNPITQDEDLELIFSRFDPNVKVEIIRDVTTGDSLQYAFAEFTTPQQAAEAYFKMNNALVDDRRIKVDFSQSVAKLWDKYNQRFRRPHPPSPPPATARGGAPFGGSPPSSHHHHRNDIGSGRSGRNHDPHRGGRRGSENFADRFQPRSSEAPPPPPRGDGRPRDVPPRDEFGRERTWRREGSSGNRIDGYMHREGNGNDHHQRTRRDERDNGPTPEEWRRRDGRDGSDDRRRRRHNDEDQWEETQDWRHGEKRGHRGDEDDYQHRLRRRDEKANDDEHRRRQDRNHHHDDDRQSSFRSRQKEDPGDEPHRRSVHKDANKMDDRRRRDQDKGLARDGYHDSQRHRDHDEPAYKHETSRPSRNGGAARDPRSHDTEDHHHSPSVDGTCSPSPHGRGGKDDELSSSDASSRRRKHRKIHKRRHHSRKRSRHDSDMDRDRRRKHRKRSSSPQRGKGDYNSGGIESDGSRQRDRRKGRENERPAKRDLPDADPTGSRHRHDRKRHR